MSTTALAWPALPLASWNDTRDTLHMWTQIVGKTRLALAPMVNHWWQVPLYVSARGLTTSRMPYGNAGFSVELDFIDHTLQIQRDDGRTWSMALAPRSVADFYQAYMAGLRSLGIDVHIWPVPSEIADGIRFTDDETHGSYDARAASDFWHALAQASRMLEIFRGRFIGKASPVHFFWGSFDLACTRFNGARAPQHPGGVPGLPDWITREAYSHECISAGWWPGAIGSPIVEPVFYAYAYPEPKGCPTAQIRPDAGFYHDVMHEWILPYDAVRTSADPDAAALDFFQSTYDAAATLGGWDRASLERGESSRSK
ncbi:MAG: hypothetical protein JWO39_2250 [Gemmatimonadetes bacterium]|nr:hypothetical protein [Gemmatimonadota bacterium]